MGIIAVGRWVSDLDLHLLLSMLRAVLPAERLEEFPLLRLGLAGRLGSVLTEIAKSERHDEDWMRRLDEKTGRKDWKDLQASLSDDTRTRTEFNRV